MCDCRGEEQRIALSENGLQEKANRGAGAGWPPAVARLIRLALLTMAATVPFAIEPIYSRPSVSQSYYVEWTGLTVGILVFAMILVLRLPLGRPTALFWCYLVYLAVIFVSIVARPVPGYGFANAILPLTGAVVLLLLELMPINRHGQESLFLMLVGVGFMSAAYGILQNFGVELFPSVVESERQVLSSFFGHSNFMASFLAPILFLAAYFAEPSRDSRLRLMVGVAIGTTLVCLYWAGTRAATLAILVGAVGLVRWRWPRVTIDRRRLATFTAVILVLGMAAMLWGQYGGRHRETLLRRLSSHREMSNRAFLWLIAIEMIREKPILGIGYGRYNAEFWPYCERYVQRPGNEMFSHALRQMRGSNPGQAHNDLLEVACETGVFGTAAYIALWVVAFVFCRRCARVGRPSDQRLARYLRAAFLCVFVDSLFGFPLQLPASAVLFWILLGTAAQTYRRVIGQWASAPANDIPVSNRIAAESGG